MIIPEVGGLCRCGLHRGSPSACTAAQFADMVGDFLIPQESDGVLWRVWWDAASKTFAHEQLSKVGPWGTRYVCSDRPADKCGGVSCLESSYFVSSPCARQNGSS